MTKIDLKNLKTLIAVDVSGSVLDNKISEKVRQALSMIELKKIDLCTFSTEVQGKLVGVSKSSPEILDLVDQLSLFEPKGTEIQCVVNFAKKEGYDQVVVITDGQLTTFDDRDLSYIWILDLDSNKELELSKKSTYYYI